jgi:hypothetical protein
MKHGKAPLLLLALFGLMFSAATAVAQDAEPTTSKMKYKVARKWTTILPQEVWSNASGSLAIPHAGGEGFVTSIDGTKLLVDTTGDGRTNDVVKGIGGSLTLKGKDEQGRKFQYAVRFRKQGAAWQYATSGSYQGRLEGEKITLIDLNNNGVYNDYGVDAMIVGKSKAAGYLSRVVNLKGNLFNLEVEASGRTVSATPYTGEVGTLDIRNGFKSYGQLVSAVVSNDEGDVSFDVARAKKGLKVPAGDYRLTGGYCVKGSETARIRQGTMKPLTVKADDTAALTWGAPLTVDFKYTIEGETIKVPPPPANVKYYGAAGEEYYDWQPDATSPEIIITNAKTGGEVGKGRFGGC